MRGLCTGQTVTTRSECGMVWYGGYYSKESIESFARKKKREERICDAVPLVPEKGLVPVENDHVGTVTPDDWTPIAFGSSSQTWETNHSGRT